MTWKRRDHPMALCLAAMIGGGMVFGGGLCAGNVWYLAGGLVVLTWTFWSVSKWRKI